MSATPADAPLGVLCLGEAIVDLICERAVAEPTDADRFVPHLGGVVANVAVQAARAGARAALAGAAGEDPWGRWLRRRLEREGVEVSRFVLAPGARTKLALVTVDAAGEPHYELFGGAAATIADAVGGDLEAAVASARGLFLSSNTLVADGERELTMRARERALTLGRPVVFDPNLRLHRWEGAEVAIRRANACVPGALLVRANGGEAALLSGESDPEAAAQALVRRGARMVLITLGSAGAILRGEQRADVPAVPAQVRSTVGAGDVLAGLLLARLERQDFDPAAVAGALPEALVASARACERWGALD